MYDLMTVSTFAINAQAPQDRPGGGIMNEMMKQRLKDEIKLTDVQIDSVTLMILIFKKILTKNFVIQIVLISIVSQ